MQKCPICNNEMSVYRLQGPYHLLCCTSCRYLLRDTRTAPALNVIGRGKDLSKVSIGIRNNILFERIRRFLLCHPNVKRILDCGCGNGFLIKKLAKIFPRKEFVGIDPNYRLLNSDGTIANLKIFRTTLEKFSSQTKFDLILMIHVIEHFENLEKALHKFNILSSMNAFILGLTPNAENIALKFFKKHWWHLGDPTHRRFFSRKSLEMLFKKYSFRILKISYPLLDGLGVEAWSLRDFLGLKNPHYITMDYFISALFLLTKVFLPNYLRPSIMFIVTKTHNDYSTKNVEIVYKK